MPDHCSVRQSKDVDDSELITTEILLLAEKSAEKYIVSESSSNAQWNSLQALQALVKHVGVLLDGSIISLSAVHGYWPELEASKEKENARTREDHLVGDGRCVFAAENGQR